MGKPFSQELQKLGATYKWASQVELNIPEEYLSKVRSSTSIVVGSGGSFSACHFLAMFQQKMGYISRATTPLDLFYAKETIPPASIIFISASGKNSDILFAHKLCIEFEPKTILSICMKTNSLLAKASAKYSISRMLEFDLPSGKDGFLATNSLMAYFVILARLFNKKQPGLTDLIIQKSLIKEINDFSQLLDANFTLTILYSGWTLPVASDLESKFVEAGLGNVQLADYRNFAHGRHNWFDKKSKQAAIVSLITHDDEEIAERTLSLLPKKIPVLKLKSSFLESDASIDLLNKSFYLVESVGKLVSIDPGRPGVPSYGSRLYNLKYGSSYLKKITDEKSGHQTLPIIRKIGYADYMSLSGEEKTFWQQSLTQFKRTITKAKFGGIIFDYDGTLCDAENRFNLPRQEIKKELLRILKGKAVIGIATGRGQSVRKDLQQIIPKALQKRVLIGYYNCSQIGLLNDDSLPEKNISDSVMDKVIAALKENKYVNGNIVIEQKPKQIEIRITNKVRSGVLKKCIFDILVAKFYNEIKILESSHSIDIITSDISKRLIIDKCKNLAKEYKLPGEFICIGDKGKFPGNDYGLLSGDFSLSVDEVSADALSCWNLASLGVRNSDATLEYLSAVSIEENGSVRLNLTS